MAVVGPSLAEADVCETDGAPGEESGKTRKGEQPVEDGDTRSVEIDEGEEAANENGNSRCKRSSRLVDVGEDLGGISLLRKSSEGTRTTIDTGGTDGKDRHQNDDVHEVIEAVEASIATNKHEGGSLSIGVSSLGEQSRVVGVDEDTNEEETENVEDSDTPEDLLDGTRQRLDGVTGLGSGKTNKFSTGERESGSDEHGAETSEAILESTGIIPVPGTPVLIITTTLGTATEDEDEGDDHEDDGGSELQNRGPELLLGVSDTTEDGDNSDDEEEDNNPDSDTDINIPVVDSDTGDNQLEGKDNSPLEDIVPTHGETPRRIDEASRVGVETTRDRVHDSEFTESED